MGAQHTPGPWTLTHVSGSNFAVQTFEVRGMFGDEPNIYPIFNRNSSAIDGGVIHTSPANARLIAAAPELLEALSKAVAFYDALLRPHAPGEAKLLDEMSAAIARATGAA